MRECLFEKGFGLARGRLLESRGRLPYKLRVGKEEQGCEKHINDTDKPAKLFSFGNFDSEGELSGEEGGSVPGVRGRANGK